jgi:hypothetical protein
VFLRGFCLNGGCLGSRLLFLVIILCLTQSVPRFIYLYFRYNGETLQAEEHGLTLGDVLLTVNGVSVASLDADELNILISNQDDRLDMIFLCERVSETGAETMREIGESNQVRSQHLLADDPRSSTRHPPARCVGVTFFARNVV